MTGAVPGFEKRTFTFEGREHAFYRGGTKGSAVVVLHESPGLHPKMIPFAQALVAEGYRVYMPSLFGRDGAPVDRGAWLRMGLQLCIRREFEIFRDATSAAMTWLRELARLANDECGGTGVGVVGMCFTGGFALAMAVDESVVAPVLSQPSLPWAPFPFPQKSQIGLSPEDLKAVKDRARDGLQVLGLRFTNDGLCPRERFTTYKRALGPAFREFPIKSPDERNQIRSNAHSVLASDFVDLDGHPTRLALQAVFDFLDERLRGSRGAPQAGSTR